MLGLVMDGGLGRNVEVMFEVVSSDLRALGPMDGVMGVLFVGSDNDAAVPSLRILGAACPCVGAPIELQHCKVVR